ncbi:MAG TPA: SagB/ThcOx family dehydrogenase [Microlunatus sp.]|nr:SagB/ThcOx family dehydrogenase [Microlunatus sp.]
MQRLVADAPRHIVDSGRVALPKPEPRLLEMSLGEAIARRHSGRVYGSAPIPASQLSTLLTSALGVRRGPDGVHQPTISRNVTNAGNLGSVEVYPIIQRVDGVSPGIYHFDTVEHDLALIIPGQFSDWLREVVFFQEEFSDGAVVLILTSAVGRLTSKYGPRGYRFALFDVGHVSQNIYLLATALELQVCATAGFVDEAFNAVLNLDGLDECASLVLVLGATPDR